MKKRESIDSRSELTNMLETRKTQKARDEKQKHYTKEIGDKGKPNANFKTEEDNNRNLKNSVNGFNSRMER